MILPATEANIQLAAEAIRSGKLVGLPTETVYGIAANALDPPAVQATFMAKGRPSENPLIVHLASIASLSSVARSWPPVAEALADRFWPGPLTLVLPKRPSVPDVTTGGLDTVAVRVPRHPVARELIRVSGTPLSAPSANPFMGLSPTRTSDIDDSILRSLAYVLDGGPCEVGLESTVLDLSGPEPRLLRPGGISGPALAEVLGFVPIAGGLGERRSPGMYSRHYAPRAPVVLVERLGAGDVGIALFTAPPPAAQTSAARGGVLVLPLDPTAYAAGLYAALHELDRRSPTAIYVERPPDTPAWAAVWDRLRRASGTL